MTKNPKAADSMHAFFQGDRGSRPNWVDWFPVKERLLHNGVGPSTTADTILLVDVGGGRGHDIESFKRKFPELRGRYILHDLPQVINDDTLVLDPAIEKIPLNFFKERAVSGISTSPPILPSAFHLTIGRQALISIT